MAKVMLLLKDHGPIGGFEARVRAENGNVRALLDRGQCNFASKQGARAAFKRWCQGREAKQWAKENAI